MNFKRSIGALALIFVISAGAFCQTPAQTAAAAIAPVVDVSGLPDKVVLVGAGIHNGQPIGFTNILVHAAGPVYAALAEDIAAGKTSTRVGLETIIFRRKGLYFTAKGNAGVATGQAATGGSYGVGGSVLFDLARLKLPGYVAAFSGTWDYSNVADLAAEVSRGNVRPVFSGGTYRFCIGRTF